MKLPSILCIDRNSFKFSVVNKALMEQINYNGRVFNAEQPLLTAANRAFRYGDALFESMFCRSGQIPLWPWHYARLLRGMKQLQLETEEERWHAVHLLEEVQKISKELELGRIRFTVFRKEGGLYTPATNEAAFLIEASPLSSDPYIWTGKGLEVKVFPEPVLLAGNYLSNLKTANGLPYVMASLYRKAQGIGDCLLLNQHGRIAEASSSNIFVYWKGQWHTPPLSEGGLDGVARKVLLELFGTDLGSSPITPKALEQAEEAVLCNAMWGIRPIRTFRETTYGIKKGEALFRDFCIFTGCSA